MSEALPPIPDVQRLVDEYPCGLLVTSVRGTILRVNETLCRWIGWSADDLIQKKRLQELFTVGGRIFHQTHWSPTLQMQGSVSEVKFDVVHKDGHTLPMMLNAVRRTIDGHEYEQVALIRAEERNRYELELLLARQRADNLVQQERSAQQGLVAAQSRLLQAVRIGSLFLWDVDPESGGAGSMPRSHGCSATRHRDRSVNRSSLRPSRLKTPRRKRELSAAPWLTPGAYTHGSTASTAWTGCADSSLCPARRS